MATIAGAIRRDDTMLRIGGDGLVSAITWTADDRQLVVISDGAGWPEIPKDAYFSSRLFAVGGSPDSLTFPQLVSGYPDVPLWDFLQGGAPYYARNVLAVDGQIYQFLSTRSTKRPFTHAKLIYSPDNGRTWCNQDGSVPVVFESRQSHSRENMAFFQEPQDSFSQLSFLQMGKDYRDNRDGYVYVYAPNGTTEGTANELVMFRVPKDKVPDRQAYEYFAGLRADGGAEWVADIAERDVVHTFPGGLVPPESPWSWLPSVAYNAPLGVYLMANCSGINGGTCIAVEPTYLGLWVAPDPWGPWRQIHEETAWTTGRDPEARPTNPVIVPKWTAADGKSFWIVWCDVHQTTSEDLLGALIRSYRDTYEEWMRARLRWRQFNPYFGFNCQRVDLVVK